MRVLLISHGAGPYGAERILLELARRLPDRGHEVTLAFPHQGPAVDMARDLPGVTLSVWDTGRLPRNLGEAVRYFGAAPRTVREIRRRVAELAPDVVWVNSMYNAWAAMGAGLVGVPTLWQLHERSLPGPPGWALAAVVGLTARRAVAVSDFVAGPFRRFPWLGQRVEVLHNPLLHEQVPHRTPDPTSAFTVGYVGQLEPRKRVVDFVRALSRLPGVRGVLVGDGKGRPRVEAEVRRSAVEDRLELMGYRDDVPAQMGRFHCLVMPSVNEPFGLAVLEAMARGIPVVAARSGALPELLGDAGLFHRPRDPEDLARQVARLRDDPALRSELSSRAVARARSFGPDPWIAAVDDLLNRVTGAGGP